MSSNGRIVWSPDKGWHDGPPANVSVQAGRLVSEPVDNYGTGGDWCPECAADWKRPHRDDCSQFEPCQYPPGCTAHAMLGRVLCPEHFAALSALFAPATS